MTTVPPNPNSLVDMKNQQLKAAREHLMQAMIFYPSYREEYKEINNLIAEIEKMLGVI